MSIRKLSDKEILALLYEERALLKELQLKKISQDEYDEILYGLLKGNEESIDNISNKEQKDDFTSMALSDI